MSTIAADEVRRSLGGPKAPLSIGLAKALANYNQNANSIRDSYNLTTISDNSAGNFTVGFSNVFTDADYFRMVTPSKDGAAADEKEIHCGDMTNKVAGSQVCLWTDSGTTLADNQHDQFKAMGDLA